MSVRVYVDLETTGIDPEKHAIIEVGAAVFEGGLEVAAFEELVNPGEAALEAASRRAMDVNKIDLVQVRAARPTVVVAEALRDFLKRHPGVLYAFPVEFESSFLRKPPWNLTSWGDCVMKAVREMMIAENALALGFDGKPRRPKLGEAAAFFGVTGCGPAHRSLSDARKTGRIHHEFLLRQESEDESRSIGEIS